MFFQYFLDTTQEFFLASHSQVPRLVHLQFDVNRLGTHQTENKKEQYRAPQVSTLLLRVCVLVEVSVEVVRKVVRLQPRHQHTPILFVIGVQLLERQCVNPETIFEKQAITTIGTCILPSSSHQ